MFLLISTVIIFEAYLRCFRGEVKFNYSDNRDISKLRYIISPYFYIAVINYIHLINITSFWVWRERLKIKSSLEKLIRISTQHKVESKQNLNRTRQYQIVNTPTPYLARLDAEADFHLRQNSLIKL